MKRISPSRARIKAYDTHIQAMARDDARASQLMQLSGIGPTTATCLLDLFGPARGMTG
jgi:transposase